MQSITVVRDFCLLRAPSCLAVESRCHPPACPSPPGVDSGVVVVSWHTNAPVGTLSFDASMVVMSPVPWRICAPLRVILRKCVFICCPRKVLWMFASFHPWSLCRPTFPVLESTNVRCDLWRDRATNVLWLFPHPSCVGSPFAATTQKWIQLASDLSSGLLTFFLVFVRSCLDRLRKHRLRRKLD